MKLKEFGADPQYLNITFWHLGHLKDYPIANHMPIHAYLEEVVLNQP
jgi:hypothetical protein